MTKERGVEPRRVPVARWPAFEREKPLIFLGVVLRENAHANLVERCAGQRTQRFFLLCIAAVRPRVTRGAEFEIRRAVGIGEMKRGVHVHRPVVSSGRWPDDERTGLPVEFWSVAVRDVLPFARQLRHETDTINVFAIVKPGDFVRRVALAERRGQCHVGERIAVGRSVP